MTRTQVTTRDQRPAVCMSPLGVCSCADSESEVWSGGLRSRVSDSSRGLPTLLVHRSHFEGGKSEPGDDKLARRSNLAQLRAVFPFLKALRKRKRRALAG